MPLSTSVVGALGSNAPLLQVSCGVSMDHYLVYCKLMRAGYIVQRCVLLVCLMHTHQVLLASSATRGLMRRHPSCWSLKPTMDAQSVWPHWYGGADQRQAGSCSVSLALPAKLSRAHCTSSEESAAAAWVGLVSSTERSSLEVSGLPRCTDASPGCVAPNGTVLTPCAYPKMMPLTKLRAKTQCVEGKAKPGAAALLVGDFRGRASAVVASIATNQCSSAHMCRVLMCTWPTTTSVARSLENLYSVL